MSDVSLSNVDQSHPAAGIRIPALVRAGIRLVALLGWSLGCRLALVAVGPLRLIAPRRSRNVRKAIARAWIKGVRPLIGARVTVQGTAPTPPFFLVLNHLAWIDFFVMNNLCDAVPVVEAPVGEIPIVGSLTKALSPIFVRRVKQDTPRVNELMVKAIEAGHSLMLAPETPETVIPLGSGVRLFRGGLLESAVRTGKAVHYLSLTYRTPAGCPPPSKVLVFGPNPLYRTPDGRIPDSELKAHGPQRSFLRHLLGVLALPWHDFIVTFGPRPVPAGTDRIALANQLHQAVARLFTPIE